MLRAVERMRHTLLRKTDLVIEMRDARVPASSANPHLIGLVDGKRKDRIVVYNKRELADPAMNRLLLSKQGQEEEAVLMSTDSMSDINNLMRRVTARLSQGGGEARRFTLMIVGIPNVGKSTLINCLRSIGLRESGKAVATGALPGVTRHAGQLVRIHEEPPIYVVDTPGVLMPRFEDRQTGMRVAITGGVFEGVVGKRALVDFALYELNRLQRFEYVEYCGLAEATDAVDELLEQGARRFKALLPGATPDYDKVMGIFMRAFREGKLGRVTLDDAVDCRRGGLLCEQLLE